jgi:glycerophosphoryl diester phosphodiesterase
MVHFGARAVGSAPVWWMVLTAMLTAAAAVPAVAGSNADAGAERPLVIAHRGASGYLPEHTLAAYAMAYAQGADYLEPDVVITRDGHAVAMHDLYLDAVTNVGDVFTQRAREDGLHYVIDFTLEELRRLRVHERSDPDTGEAAYPARFPVGASSFSIVTLDELIELTQGLNASTGRDVGIYPELKSPGFHMREGQDIAAIVLRIVEAHGYTEPHHRCLIQSFEAAALIRLRNDLQSRLSLIQLIGADAGASDAEMLTADGLDRIAEYADGIGPHLSSIVSGFDEDGRPQITELVRNAHERGLLVHAYTLRADQAFHALTFVELVRLLAIDVGVDGFFTDHPDKAVAALKAGYR